MLRSCADAQCLEEGTPACAPQDSGSAVRNAHISGRGRQPAPVPTQARQATDTDPSALVNVLLGTSSDAPQKRTKIDVGFLDLSSSKTGQELGGLHRGTAALLRTCRTGALSVSCVDTALLGLTLVRHPQQEAPEAGGPALEHCRCCAGCVVLLLQACAAWPLQVRRLEIYRLQFCCRTRASKLEGRQGGY